MKQQFRLRGVNLGGWLVLERWITPSLFKGSATQDEHGFMQQGNAADKLKHHRDTFITEKDFIWLTRHGVNAVRLPLGFWVVKAKAPFVSAEVYVDWVFAMAEKYNMQVLLCFHGAPGSQNGKDHSGQKGEKHWFQLNNMTATASVIRMLTKRYARHKQLWGIELLNEPSATSIRERFLLSLWTRWCLFAFSLLYPTVRFVYSDAFRPATWNRATKAVMDVHHYQCFSPTDRKRKLAGHLKKARTIGRSIELWQRKQPVIIGEWSLGLDGQSLHGESRRSAEKAFATAQLEAYSDAAGWFFWTYKTEANSGWNFRYLVETGIITSENLLQ